MDPTLNQLIGLLECEAGLTQWPNGTPEYVKGKNALVLALDLLYIYLAQQSKKSYTTSNQAGFVIPTKKVSHQQYALQKK